MLFYLQKYPDPSHIFAIPPLSSPQSKSHCVLLKKRVMHQLPYWSPHLDLSFLFSLHSNWEYLANMPNCICTYWLWSFKVPTAHGTKLSFLKSELQKHYVSWNLSNSSNSSRTALSSHYFPYKVVLNRFILFLDSGSLHMLLPSIWNAVVLIDFFSLSLPCLNRTSSETFILLHSYKNFFSFATSHTLYSYSLLHVYVFVALLI